MKTYITPILLAILLVLSAPAASALVDANLQRYDPTPAQPGDLLTVYVAVTNDDSSIARNIQLEILPTNTIIPEGQSVINVGTLSELGTYTTSLQVRVASDTPAGTAILRMRTKQDGSEWQERTGTINIKSSESAVLINNVQVSPETINPGKASTVTLTLENNAGGLLRDVTTQLDLTETPFVPVDSSTRKKVSELKADQQAKVTYTLVAQPGATANIYRVPVTLSFLDEDGQVQSDKDTIGLYVDTPTSIRAIVDDVTATTNGAEVAVRIVNKGLSEVKFVEAELSEAQGYTIPISQQVAYVGNIDSDDWETLRFNIESEQTEVQVPMEYTFQDAFNNKITMQETLRINIPEQQSEGTGTGLILVVLLLIGGGVWYVRRRRKKSKKSKR
jgi:LPXTG-motif cell wall-anchored protein